MKDREREIFRNKTKKARGREKVIRKEKMKSKRKREIERK